MQEKLIEHKEYIYEYGVDTPEVANWKWENK
jgi:xylulose-5-phosphate/fructose-6-phosphate phosphoketolase